MTKNEMAVIIAKTKFGDITSKSPMYSNYQKEIRKCLNMSKIELSNYFNGIIDNKIAKRIARKWDAMKKLLTSLLCLSSVLCIADQFPTDSPYSSNIRVMSTYRADEINGNNIKLSTVCIGGTIYIVASSTNGISIVPSVNPKTNKPNGCFSG